MHAIRTSSDSLVNYLSTLEQTDYNAGHAQVFLTKSAGSPKLTYSLSGRLYLSDSGWLLLDVPNALVRGAFDALDEHGIELPLRDGKLNAHITVFTGDEVKKIGADKLTERGHSFSYSLGPIKEVTPDNWNGVSKVWFIQISSPDLIKLRKSYGLTPLPNGDHPFHLTIAIRKTKVLQDNDVSKAAADHDAFTAQCELEAQAKEADEKKKPTVIQIHRCTISVLHGIEEPKNDNNFDSLLGEASSIIDNLIDKFQSKIKKEKKAGVFDSLTPSDDNPNMSVRILMPASVPNKYLLQRMQFNKGHRVPGGRVEPGETLREAATRELNEEFGLSKSLSNKRLQYLGPNPDKKYKHHHYFYLKTHGLSPRKYVASNDPKEIIHLAEIDPKEKGYYGPDVDMMLRHLKDNDKKSILEKKYKVNLFKEANHVANTSNHQAEERQDDTCSNMVLAKFGGLFDKYISKPEPVPIAQPEEIKKEEPELEKGPFFYINAINEQGAPIDIHQHALSRITDPNHPFMADKPDDTWYNHSHGHETYLTASGLKKYLDSGLYNWHRRVTDSDLAIMIAKELAKNEKDDENRKLVKPKKVKPHDIYYISKNRVKPLTAQELLDKYTDRPETKVAALSVSAKVPKVTVPSRITRIMPSPKPTIMPKPSLISPIIDKPLLKSIMEPTKPAIEAPKVQPSKLKRAINYIADVPKDETFSEHPYRNTYNLLNPSWPILKDKYPKANKYLRRLSMGASLGGGGFALANAVKDTYDLPLDAATTAAGVGGAEAMRITPDDKYYKDDYDKVRDIAKKYRGSILENQLLPESLGGETGPVTDMLHEMAKNELMNRTKAGPGIFRYQYPVLSKTIDTTRMFTPLGAAQTALLHMWPEHKYNSREESQKIFNKYRPQFEKDPKLLLNSPTMQQFGNIALDIAKDKQLTENMLHKQFDANYFHNGLLKELKRRDNLLLNDINYKNTANAVRPLVNTPLGTELGVFPGNPNKPFIPGKSYFSVPRPLYVQGYKHISDLVPYINNAATKTRRLKNKYEQNPEFRDNVNKVINGYTGAD